MINPDQFQPKSPTPRVVLTELRINGVSRIIEGGKPVSDPATPYMELSLAHDENDLLVNFTGLYFTAPP